MSVKYRLRDSDPRAHANDSGQWCVYEPGVRARRGDVFGARRYYYYCYYCYWYNKLCVVHAVFSQDNSRFSNNARCWTAREIRRCIIYTDRQRRRRTEICVRDQAIGKLDPELPLLGKKNLKKSYTNPRKKKYKFLFFITLSSWDSYSIFTDKCVFTPHCFVLCTKNVHCYQCIIYLTILY